MRNARQTYQKLNQLHEQYASKGLAILGFPCNQFGAQEPGTPDEIFAFAHTQKKVAFDMFRKVRHCVRLPLRPSRTRPATNPAPQGDLPSNPWDQPSLRRTSVPIHP